jgi:hypothetical protein
MAGAVAAISAGIFRLVWAALFDIYGFNKVYRVLLSF